MLCERPLALHNGFQTLFSVIILAFRSWPSNSSFGFRFWVKHLSLRRSILWSALLDTPTKINTTSIFLFPYIKERFLNHNCHAEFFIPFNFSTPSISSAIQFHLADFSFQRTDLDNKSTFTLFSDFLQNLTEHYQLIVIDASKSAHITNIAACSEIGHLACRVHNINSVFTPEVLVICMGK